MKGRRLIKRSLAIALSLVVGMHSIPVFAKEDLNKTNPLMNMPVFYQPTENVQVDIPVVFVEEDKTADALELAVSNEVAETVTVVNVKDAEAGEKEEVAKVSTVQDEKVISALKTAGDYEYELYDNSYVVISKYNGTDAEVVIPAELDGYPVQEIGYGAFDGCATLTSVEIPASVTKIGSNAFYSCQNLKEVTIAEGLTTIESYAFYNCKRLTEVKLPDSLTTFSYGVFGNCISLSKVNYPKSLEKVSSSIFYGCDSLKSMEIPEGVTQLPAYFFAEADNLQEVILPDGLLSIGQYAFKNCKNLKEITLPSSVTEIDQYAFYECNSLTAIEIPAGVSEIGYHTFYNCTNLEEVVLPEGLTTIDGYAFYNCINLPEIELPDSITTLGAGAFTNCTGLSQVNYPKSLENAGYSIFSGCVNLKRMEVPEGVTCLPSYVFYEASYLEEVILPKGLQEIGQYVFYFCSGLTKIEIPAEVSKIGMNAFYYCSNLKEVTMSEGMTTIENYAFFNCTGLTEVELPNSITTLGYGVFSNCAGLSKVTYPQSLENVGSSIFSGCVNLKSMEVPEGVTRLPDNIFNDATYLEEVKLPASLQEIGSHAFYGCKNMKTIELPENITKIGSSAFMSCSGLTKLEIPAGIKEISGYAFYECSDLSEVILPEGLITIDGYAFYGCKSLTEIELPDSITTLGSGVFNNCTELSQVNYPKSLESTGYNIFSGCVNLKSMEVPEGVTSLCNYIFYDAEYLEEVTLPESLQEIGTHAFYGCECLSKIEIPSGVQKIDYGAFFDCSNLSEVLLPEGLTFIDGYAFYNCTGLKEIKLPDSITELGNGVFSSCTALSQVNYPKNLEKAGGNIFNGCTNLKSMEVPEGVTCLPDYIFYEATYLEEVILPEGLLEIGGYAFAGCDKLATVKIPASVTEIGQYAFSNCSGLTAIEIPVGVDTIGYQAFYCCSNLSKVSLPSSLTAIESYAFSYCTSLTEIELPDSVTKLGYGVFNNCTALSKVNYPKNLVESGSSIFSDCAALKSIVVPEGVTVLPDYALGGANYLEEVKLPESLQEIGNFAFQSCNSLKSIELPSGVTEIGQYAFSFCNSLTEIEIPSKVTAIRYMTFYDCEGLTEVILPQGLTTIENYAFENAVSLKTLWVPGSVKEIGYAFQNCSNLTVQCPAVSHMTIYAMENQIPYETYASTYIGEADDILDRNGTYYYADTESKAYNGHVLFVLDYKLNANSENCHNKKVQLLVPRNSVLQETTLRLDGVLCQNFTYEESVLTIPITKSEGKIEFYVVPTDAEKMASYAKLNYSNKDYRDESEIIGILQDDIVNLTISCEDTITKNTFTVNGIGPKEGTVSIYLDDTKLGDVQTSKTGKYSKTITLTNPQENKGYVVKAESTVNGETYSAKKKVTYSSSMPELKDLKLYYNNHNDAAVDLLDMSTTQYISFNPSVPYTFTVDFTNEDQIRDVYIVSTRNNEKKYMEAVYNEREGIYVASGYFDESNHYYVPGTISVDYNRKQEQVKISESLNLDTTNISDGIKKTTVEKVDTGNANEEKYVFDITETLKESGKDFGKTLLEMATSTYDNVNDMSQSDALGLLDAISTGAGYFIPDENGNNWFAKADWTDDNTYTLLAKDVSGMSDKVVKFVIKVKPSDALTTLDDIAPCLGYVAGGLSILHDVNEYGDENRALREQIMMSSGITDKNEALELADQLFMDQCAMTIVLTMAPLLVVTAGVSAPVAIGVTAVCGVAKAVSEVFWDLRIAEILGMPISMRWIIDPSGYVYESVTTNRISGVKVTAYYKENLSDETVILWDAGEYDQMNPLITDKDGKYAWDVPEGFWQVKYEKEGYETTYSEWLPVPPPQTEVNIRMVPTADLTVDAVNVYADHAEVVFSHYVIPDTVSNVKIIDTEGKEVSYTLDYDKNESDIAGTVYARNYRLMYQGKEAAHGEKLTVQVPVTTLSADNKPCVETSITGTCRKPLVVKAEEQVTVAMGESTKIPVTFENYEEGYNLKAVSQYGYILSADATLQVDKDGKGYVSVKGELYGTSEVSIYCDDKVLAAIQITVSGEASGYSISYVLNGGTQNQENPQNYQSTDGDIQLKAPTREGYEFGGWYSDEEFTNKVEKIVGGSKEDFTFYAKWSPKTYTLNYDVNGGKALEKVTLTVTYDKAYGELPTPERDGYSFAGWYTAAEGGEAVSTGTICKGDATIYAHWEKNQESVKDVFTDIPENAWFVKAVQYAYDNNIMAGMGEVFQPNGKLTREQFVQVLYNNSGKPSVDIENKFPDVKDAWYKNAVLWANANDIANGKGNGDFGVGDNISRQDLALMLYKYAKLNGFDLTANEGEINKYADGTKVSNYAKVALDWAITQGIMSGKGKKGEDISTFQLDPHGTATRAECASMMMKLLTK